VAYWAAPRLPSTPCHLQCPHTQRATQLAYPAQAGWPLAASRRRRAAWLAGLPSTDLTPGQTPVIDSGCRKQVFAAGSLPVRSTFRAQTTRTVSLLA
jgi:hypothetical protein